MGLNVRDLLFFVPYFATSVPRRAFNPLSWEEQSPVVFLKWEQGGDCLVPGAVVRSWR